MKLPSNPNTRFLIITGIITGILLVSAASWTLAKSYQAGSRSAIKSVSTTPEADANQTAGKSKVELSVSNLSCGGCIENINKSLAPLPGIGKVMVDIASGSAEVYFDAARLDEPSRIAAAITDAGYPAKIVRLVSAKQVGKALEQAAVKAKSAIASVGQLEISRQDFMAELSHARDRYQATYGPNVFMSARGSQFLGQVKAQIATRLISEQIKMQEVERAGYQLPPGKHDQAMQDFLSQRNTTQADFKKSLASSGYDVKYFDKKFSQRVRLQSYLDDRVLSDSIDPDDRQQRYANWLTNARALAKVVYFDKEIESLVQSAGGSGGCGGGGGSSCGGGSCSAAR